jgi:2-amino-4-hydroxy-6-hydroxymethyldihydropteridine diphosphokinase
MIIISLGSNVTSWWGTPPNTILCALHEISTIGITIVRQSALYCSLPYGVTNQPPFVNAAALIRTALPPVALLTVLKKIEAKAGRKPTYRWGPRALDIDIIDYHARVLNYTTSKHPPCDSKGQSLILPHPDVQHRPFVLRPMLDIAQYWHHPISGKGVEQLLSKLHFCKNGNILKKL